MAGVNPTNNLLTDRGVTPSNIPGTAYDSATPGREDSRTKITGLPTELLWDILDPLGIEVWKNVCLVSHEMCRIAQPLLYKDCHIPGVRIDSFLEALTRNPELGKGVIKVTFAYLLAFEDDLIRVLLHTETSKDGKHEYTDWDYIEPPGGAMGDYEDECVHPVHLVNGMYDEEEAFMDIVVEDFETDEWLEGFIQEQETYLHKRWVWMIVAALSYMPELRSMRLLADEETQKLVFESACAYDIAIRGNSFPTRFDKCSKAGPRPLLGNVELLEVGPDSAKRLETFRAGDDAGSAAWAKLGIDSLELPSLRDFKVLKGADRYHQGACASEL
ncbi:hypothetical protein LTS18_004446 [Coniosporium uncinatum]|uniref:Uncharacterized protein n=1 Tax=Coniosporium uncinatum TaxID=93489 RepID=A0ACC3D640_9PEZI|nr:hypothetical protein LTS18_004446 [Coniosporium uncinatum]